MLFKLRNHDQFLSLTAELAKHAREEQFPNETPFTAEYIREMAASSVHRPNASVLPVWFRETKGPFLLEFSTHSTNFCGTNMTELEVALHSIVDAEWNTDMALRQRNPLSCRAADSLVFQQGLPAKTPIGQCARRKVKPGEEYFILDRGGLLYRDWWVCCWSSKERVKPESQREFVLVASFGEYAKDAHEAACALNSRVAKKEKGK